MGHIGVNYEHFQVGKLFFQVYVDFFTCLPQLVK